MVIGIIWKFMETFENVKKQHGVLVVEGSNPSVPTNRINELRINHLPSKNSRVHFGVHLSESESQFMD